MFGFIKNIFHKSAEAGGVATAPPPLIAMPALVPEPAPARFSSPEPVATPAPAPVFPDNVIALPVGILLGALPVCARNRVPAGSTEFVLIPVEKILPQLALGAVSLPLGELRAASAAGLFGAVDGEEQTLVPLPLAEILKQINPALLPRRTQQRRVEVPDEVVNIFGQKDQVVSIFTPAKDEFRRSTAPADPEFKPVALSTPTEMFRIVPSAPRPAAVNLPAAPSRPAPLPPSTPPPAPLPAAASPPASPEVKPAVAAEAAVVRIPLLAAQEGWPMEVLKEIAQMNLEFSAVALPLAEADAALKSGAVIFTWRQICAWIRPAPPFDPSPMVGAIKVELPLKVVAPLFLAQHRPAFTQRKVALDETIPDVFSPSLLKTETPVVASAPPAMTSSFSFPSAPIPFPARASVPAVVPETPAAPVAAPAPAPAAFDLEEILGTPEHRHSANQIVKNTTRLPGVNGALLAMNDGLLVTSALPAETKGELMAAFLPQIFGRMNQYAKELALGDLQTLSLGVGGGSWQVFKSGSVFFAVMGRPGEPLPLHPLAAIAAELGRQQK